MSRANGLLRNRVPAAPIQEAIREFMRATGMDQCAAAGFIWGSTGRLHWKRLQRFFEQEEVTFDLADHILCRIDMVDLWWSDPVLAERYQVVALSPLPATIPAGRRAPSGKASRQTGSDQRPTTAQVSLHGHLEAA